MSETVVDYEDARCVVHRVVVGPVENNVYIVRCKETGDGLLIDAANEHDLLLELCSRLGVRRVVETHGHWDHIQAVEAVRDAGYDVAVASADAAMLPSYDQLLEDDAVLQSTAREDLAAMEKDYEEIAAESSAAGEGEGEGKAPEEA